MLLGKQHEALCCNIVLYCTLLCYTALYIIVLYSTLESVLYLQWGSTCSFGSSARHSARCDPVTRPTSRHRLASPPLSALPNSSHPSPLSLSPLSLPLPLPLP